MAKQKQINMQVLLLETGLFFTCLSAAQACFMPYLSIYLRQLGLSASQVGIIFSCKNLFVASTASCLGRFLMRFKPARVFLLVATVLYLGGVLSFTIIPIPNRGLFEMYCPSDGYNSDGSSNFTASTKKLEQNGSISQTIRPESVRTSTPEYSKIIPTTVKKATSPESEIKPTSTGPPAIVSSSMPLSDTRAQSNQMLTQADGKKQLQTESELDDSYQTGNVFESENEKLTGTDPANDIQLNKMTSNSNPWPTARSAVRGRYWSNNKEYLGRQNQPFVSNKRYRDQQGYRDQSQRKYQSSQHTLPNLKDSNNYGEFNSDWNEGKPPGKAADGNGDDYVKDDILDWLLGPGREQHMGSNQYNGIRVKTRALLGRESTGTNGSDKVNSGAERTESSNTVNSTSGSSATFWIALLIVCLTAVSAGPIECMCDNALYHQLDSIDELDKYKRPTLLTMPAFAIIGLISALIVDKTPCFINVSTSHMAIHFYMSAACIGLVFLIGIIIPLSHKPKNQQEGKFVKSIKLLFNDSHTAVMCATLVVTAIIFSCSDTFLFWLIQDVNGYETTMGVSLAIAYFTELPMSAIFTPWLVQKLGNVWLLALGTACLGVQNLYLSVLWTPWAVLPIQLVHALSRSAVRGCVLAYLNEASPPGMGRAIQVTVVALEQGLGYTTGNIAWGFLFTVLGSKLVFVVAACVALVWTVFLIVCAFKLPAKKRSMYAKLLQSDLEMDMKAGGFGSDSEEEQEWLKEAIKDEEKE